ncbi:MAG: Hsp20/alpha crystallin family protein [Deltaproteobacteria bacterium]|nr:Hsp20/alpha crystallin family protein [Deltaproteobacteria bacterium]MBW2170908.1 Hsp20/alpha crystallin family protein [Deltaproteobacteria bacterium]MBW2259612.1 Hsp20/alpha crystallin family protein [Deltaproteobacteria bacterium]
MFALTPILRRKEFLSRPETDFFDRFFGDFTLPSLMFEGTEWTPAFDVSETDRELVIKAEVPGMDKKDINITVSDGMLTIKGEKKHEKKEENERYHRVETRYGTFSRTLRLPTEVKADRVDATYKDGVLNITLPKSEAVEPKKIEIKS